MVYMITNNASATIHHSLSPLGSRGEQSTLQYTFNDPYQIKNSPTKTILVVFKAPYKTGYNMLHSYGKTNNDMASAVSTGIKISGTGGIKGR